MTLADALRPNLPALPPPLLDSSAIRSVLEACECLPDALSREYGFECRLQEGEDGVDLAVAVTDDGDGCAILSGMHPHVALPEGISNHPTWTIIATFCRAWQEAGSLLHRAVSCLWLELDHAASGITAPGVFLSLRSPTVDTALEVLARLRCEPAGNVQAGLEAVFEGGGEVFQVGMFPGRSIHAVRVCLRVGTAADVMALLGRLGWQGNRDEVLRALELLAPHAQRICLDLDVLESGVAPRVGIEAYIARRQPPHEPAWHAVFQGLVDAGLCAPNKRNAALTFPGYTTDHLIYERVYVRGLEHLKVVAGAGTLEAKLYFGIFHRPRSAFTAVPA